MAQALLVADKADQSVVVQQGQPPAQMGAWLLDYDPASGGSALSAAANFASTHGFPVGTTARVVDLATTTVATYKLQSQWVQV